MTGQHCIHDWNGTGACPHCAEIPRFTQTPYKCPVCNGTGLVSRPPHIPGDQSTWISNNTGETFPCRACDGKGVIWR